MRKKLLRLGSLAVAFVMMFTNIAMAVPTKTKLSSYTLTVEDIINPYYSEGEEASAPIYTSKPEVYYADPVNFDVNLCTNDSNAISQDIRETMVERTASLDVYYKSTLELDSNSLGAVVDEWLETALAETENPDEGDYLRWVYRMVDVQTVDVIIDNITYYYHVPLSFEYYTNRTQEDLLDEKVEEVIEDFNFDANSTARQKSDAIYEYITDNVTYDYDNLDDSTYYLKHTAYAALIDGTAVCQGYATLYYRFARECGLETRVIVGTSRDENHAWNIVKMGDYYYYLDSTWDAGNIIYDYYLKGSTSFTEDHTPESQYLETQFTEKYPISETDMNLSDSGNSSLYDYTVNSGKATITKYKGNEKNVVVPARIDGYTVRSVAEQAFCENDTVETITFEEGIKYLAGIETISRCPNLKQINFPASMLVDHEKYGDSALGGYSATPVYCENLETYTVADSENAKMKVVDGILYTADGTSLISCPPKHQKSKLTIPNGVVTIAPFAFYGCEGITEIVMSDTVKYIGYWAFCTARNLEKVNISEGCRTIGQFAFGCTKIKEIHIPEITDGIMGGAFGPDCDLKKITVDPDNEHYYMQNGALTYFNDETNVRGILEYETDNAATVFTIPDNVSRIEQYAFAYANNLEKIILHDNVEHIYSYAFEKCIGLTHFEFPDGIEVIDDYTLIYCENLLSVIMPDSITEIGDLVLFGNEGCTIYGESGSVAESYANSTGNPFKRISEFTCTNGHSIKKEVIDELSYHNVCEVCGDEAQTHHITPIEPFAQHAVIEHESYQYTGKEIKPRIVEFEYDDVKFVEGVDYEIKGYYNNIHVGTGYIEIKGIGKYAGSGYIYFQIGSAPLTADKIKIEYNTTNYDGSEKCPIIKIDGLRELENFNVEYSNNINPGTATATITAWGDYEGVVKINFKIVSPVKVPNLSAPSKVTLSLYGYDDVNVSWKKVSNAAGYYVYYKAPKDKAYTFAGKTSKTSFKKSNLSDGVKYTFKVVPYSVSGGKDIVDDSYKTASIYTLKKVSNLKVKKSSSKKVKVSWKNINGESGYQISQSTKKKKVKIVSTYNTTKGKSKTISAKKGTNYFYKVRAFVKVGKAVIYGPWSTVKPYKIKK